MRIGLVLPGFSASERDWCIPALLDLVRIIAAIPSVEIEVFPLRYPPGQNDYVVYGATVHPQGGGTARRLQRLALIVHAERAIRRAHRRTPFDLLHAYWADEPGLVATRAARRLGIPSIVSLAGGELADLRDFDYGGQTHRSSRMMIKRTLRGATLVTVGSQYLQALAVSQVPDERLSSLPFGVDTELFRPCALAEECSLFRDGSTTDVHILCVGSLVPVKDHRTLIEAMTKVVRHAPQAHLHLVGEGSLTDTLKSLVDERSLSEHIHFHGSVAHHDLPRFYCSADFCVLASRHEAQAMVVLEAAACGRVTVGTVVGLLPELAAANVVPAGNKDALALAILRLVGDESLRRRLGAHACDHVSHEYRLSMTVPAQLALYHSIVDPMN